MAPTTSVEELDIVIVGAGLTGINAAYRLQTQLPHRGYAILEARDSLGGTWDFWKYPGIRSDSAMALYGFPWRPWPYEDSMAGASAIKSYIAECAASEGIDKKIRLRHRVKAANWSSDEQKWILQLEITHEDGMTEQKQVKTWWLLNCSGYYSYDKVLPPAIPGIDNFQGQVVHPQFWDEKLDYTNKKIIVIGSGATAITLLPSLAEKAKEVTMLQRSPSYVFAIPRKDKTVKTLSRWMPLSWAVTINWFQRMFAETAFVQFVLNFPNAGRKFVIGAMKSQLPKGFEIEKHFNPRYNPFEQRLCFCPGADFFKALHKPGVKIVTDVIDTVTKDGIIVKTGGEKIEADIIVTATGLHMEILSATAVTVDGKPVNETMGERYVWNACMIEGVPNAGLLTGYTAASWTPGVDVRTRNLIKVIKHQEKTGATAATPYIPEAGRAMLPAEPMMNLTSTYARAAMKRLPLVAGVGPWKAGTNWVQDVWAMLFGSVKDGMQYSFGSKSKDI
ncbi:hypothetical protein B0T21DRAFT_369101 [Apiosordaria backusii]|uniref:Uncharacterized protein n=1 Tax=Apiosordaria backusii TaxID=314023 RepID=A0AA40EBT7_9PEZI|nr:hypothetical protein B0T21DRAFT_369101 [Apiosordaria backusii]